MSSSPALLLIGWDGANACRLHRLMAAGQLPVLRGLVERGTSGELDGFGPHPRPMEWTSVLTGHHPAEHRHLGAAQWDAATRRPQASGSHTRQRKALWTLFSEAGRSVHALNWPASHPAEPVNGLNASDHFTAALRSRKTPPDGAVHPADRRDELAEGGVAPEEIEPALLRWLIPDLTPARFRRDPRARHVLTQLSELYCCHNPAIDLAARRPADLLAVFFPFVGRVAAAFPGGSHPGDPAAATPCRAAEEAVVDRACVLQDLLLGELLQTAGPGASLLLVCRPAAAVHQGGSTGLFVTAGPLFLARRGGVAGTTVWDLAPTVLHACGLPVGRDLPGRALTHLASRAEPVVWIDSWETRAPSASPSPGQEPAASLSTAPLPGPGPSLPVSPAASATPVAPGRLDPTHAWVAEDRLRGETAAHLGAALFAVRRFEEAWGCLEEAWFRRPEEVAVGLQLARCQARLGLFEEAARVFATVRDYVGPDAEGCLTLADLALELNDAAGALALARQASAHGAAVTAAAPLAGIALLHLGRWGEAEREARGGLAAEPGHLALRFLLVHALYSTERFAEARSETDRLLADHPEQPLAWYALGQLHLKNDAPEAAREAHARAVALKPGFALGGGGVLRAEDALRRKQLSFSFPRFKHVDFRELPAERKKRTTSEHLGRLREASRRRLARLARERAAAREGMRPLEVFPVAPTTGAAGPSTGAPLPGGRAGLASSPENRDGIRPAAPAAPGAPGTPGSSTATSAVAATFTLASGWTSAAAAAGTLSAVKFKAGLMS